ncbi:MAG: hypothetical protein ACE5PM_01925 [Candidatus Hydrothermarchaeales archaeon]
MEKVVCEVRCIETDEGFKIEAKGEGVRECLEAWKRGEISCCGFTGRQ